jgi:site-specific DNA-methyltransferase (adenine-specific)
MKVGMMNCKRMPLRQHEDIILFYKKQPTYNPQMTKGKMRNKKIEPTKDFEVYGQIKPIDNFNDDYYPSSILEFTNANQKDKKHTTQKPLSLMEYLVKTYSNEGNTVLDNCMGSGTTGIACKNLNRNFIGIEKDDKYFEIACKRINDHLPQISMFPYLRSHDTPPKNS